MRKGAESPSPQRFNSYLVVYPLRNSGVALLTNKSDERIFKALPGLADEISRALGAE